MAHIYMNKNYGSALYKFILLFLSGAIISLAVAGASYGAIYGVRDAQGNFMPKVTVSTGKKEVVISKIDPEEKFKSFAIVLNKKNAGLQKGLNQITVEWLNAENKGGKPTPFLGPSYDASKLRFEEPMTRSVTFRLTDKSGKNLFVTKNLSDLFTIQIDQHTLIPAEASGESDSPIRFGSGRDVSLNLDKTSIQFDESNIKKGEILNLDNRSGLDQLVGVELPEKQLLYYQIVRKPEQTKVPRENWDKFNISADSGIFVVLIPESDPAQLAALNGKDITIKVFQGDKVRETIRVPVRTTADTPVAHTDSSSGAIQPRDTSAAKPASTSDKAPVKDSDRPLGAPEVKTVAPASSSQGVSLWSSTMAWIFLALSSIVSLGLLGYGAFFLLPKIQVLEDRLAKSEMFIHGSREAIREELDQIKDEVLRRSPDKTGSE